MKHMTFICEKNCTEPMPNSMFNFKTMMVPAAGADVDTVTLSVAVVTAVAVAVDGGHAKPMLWRLQQQFLPLM